MLIIFSASVDLHLILLLISRCRCTLYLLIDEDFKYVENEIKQTLLILSIELGVHAD